MQALISRNSDKMIIASGEGYSQPMPYLRNFAVMKVFGVVYSNE